MTYSEISTAMHEAQKEWWNLILDKKYEAAAERASELVELSIQLRRATFNLLDEQSANPQG